MDFKIRRNRFSHLQNLVAVNVERSKSDLLFSVIFPKTRTDKRDFTILIQQIGAILIKNRKNCECCPGHSLTVSQPSKSLSL